MENNLYSHQQQATELAIRNNGNVALFHDCGLGKTRTMLEIYSRLRKKTPGLKLLVVCPLSLINAAWMADIAKFTAFTAEPFRQIGYQVPDIVIINYESLVSIKNLPAVRKLLITYPFMAVLDESSRLKSNKALTTKTLLQLAPLFVYRTILSGTPCPNSELELWGQIRFVRPDAFDKSFYKFRNTYFHLERNGEAMAPLQGKVMNRMMMRNIMMQGWKYTITPFLREHLMQKIAPFTDWRKKKDCLDLPEQIDEIREVQLSANEGAAYRDMKQYLVAEIGGQMVAAQVALAKILKLRECTSGFMYNADGTALPLGESKLNELKDTVEELGEQQVIIFVQFHYEVEQIQALLGEQAVTLYADTDDKDASIEAFQQGRAKYLIAHPRSAAHGLTFVNCSTMIFYSLDYSFEAHEQARNRIHRIGQRKSCLYIYLLAKESIDEELLKVLQRKQELQTVIEKIVKGVKLNAESGNEHQEQCA